MSGPTPFVGVQSGFDALFPRNQLRAYWKALHLKELDDEAIDVIADRALDRPAPQTLVNTFHMGGAIARRAPRGHRLPRALGALPRLDRRPVDRRRATTPTTSPGCARPSRASQPFGTGSVYLNFTGRADEAPSAGVDSAFGRNLQRLAEVKKAYDPHNFFNRNDNITPAR